MDSLINIGIVHPHSDSFYPETNAYIQNLDKNIFKINVFDNIYSADNSSDIIIYYGGFLKKSTRLKSKLIIEYHSLSTGKKPKIKNIIKRLFAKKADAYIFLNQDVKKNLYFYKDHEKYVFRGMGYDGKLIEVLTPINDKIYDFVYMGSLGRGGVKEIILSIASKGFTVAVIGCNEQDYNQLSNTSNIFPFSRLPQRESFQIAKKAKYGLNYTIDIYPFNIQDSTKLIEYCALGLKVVTNKYYWVNKFEKEIGASFLDINDFLNNSDILNDFMFSNGKINNYEWSKVIQKSGLSNLLLRLYKENENSNTM